MTTAIVLFTRDLRVHDHPALRAACASAERVVPCFVLDDAMLASRYAAPNRVALLRDALTDLRRSLIARGGGLVVRRGDTVEEVAALAREAGADAVHLSEDVSAHARRRHDALTARGRREGWRVEAHPGVTAVPPGELTTGDGGAYLVFSPYHRRWAQTPVRPPLPAPERVALPAGTATGTIPALDDLARGPRSPRLPAGGESAARRVLDDWLADGVEAYDEARDDLAADATSRLSAHLHLGTISPAEIVARLDLRRRGHEGFRRQLAWREFSHQLLLAHPDLPSRDLRPRGDRWRDEEDAVAAWREGRTGYPVVDAAMRQLRVEGFIHNRARMIAASFLTKHLYVDWRVGAWHFMDWLVDGDLANNFAGWQWTAGTGTDSRPNRMFNPVAQGKRHDPDGAYVRRYVEELADVDAAHVHAPWEAEGTLLAARDYPPPVVDHRRARERFLAARTG